MNSDSYFEQGQGHTICEDYATHWSNEECALAIVADGCSNSRKTDFGARIIAEVFSTSIRRLLGNSLVLTGNPTTVIKGLMHDKIAAINSQIGFQSSVYDATLVAALVTKRDNAVQLFIWGDGAVCIQQNAKESIYQVSYESNAPYYFSYELSKTGRAAEYSKLYGDSQATLLKQESSQKIPPFYWEKLELTNIQAISVMSDGMGTYTKINEENQAAPIMAEQIIKEITTFKNTVGEFVQRRMKRHQRSCRAENITHFDDISCASIIL